jgi:hypothetical protein
MAKRTAKPSRKSRKTIVKRAAKKAPARASKRTTRRPAKPANRAEVMRRFSTAVLKEESQGVEVKSWQEARQGVPGSKRFVPSTGGVEPVVQATQTVNASPRLDPLSGPMAVPKPRNEQFVLAPKRKGRKAKRIETPQDFGQVDLQQATANGGRSVGRLKAENLQRAAGRIQPLMAPSEETKGRSSKGKSSALKPGSASGLDSSYMEFGEVEIGQQTLRGSRKVGTLSGYQKADQV